jgi:fructose-bisphosphate aldolase class II
MPIATPDVYAEMLDAAKNGRFAYPAINVSSSQTLNAALQGFAEAGSDGIVQVSTGGAEYASGPTIKNMVTGAVALATYAHEVAKNYPVNIALHTDHCPKNKLDGFVRPLVALSTERVKGGGLPLYQSHMWDGSAVPVEEVRRTASATRSTRSSTPLWTTGCGPSRCSAPGRTDATSPR